MGEQGEAICHALKFIVWVVVNFLLAKIQRAIKPHSNVRIQLFLDSRGENSPMSTTDQLAIK